MGKKSLADAGIPGGASTSSSSSVVTKGEEWLFPPYFCNAVSPLDLENTSPSKGVGY